tara:strand:- start:4585 stop:4743 length:159 start_codon:yes stop_codon:yes gene_type:complete
MEKKLLEMEMLLSTLERAMTSMYELVMENHKRLNRIEKEFLALEKKVNEKKI